MFDSGQGNPSLVLDRQNVGRRGSVLETRSRVRDTSGTPPSRHRITGESNGEDRTLVVESSSPSKKTIVRRG